MHLEKIEIFGFKSFAEKTVIRFDQPITAIVGPNGCGKSNVVDAFRWVLGEGSAKSLRSDKMVDVIFSGTQKRKPLNYAQISLTFTQIKKALSLPFDELCITRKVHRNGESEWTINRNPARLKDVYKILWEAGMGKNAFYIFEQGKVDELITSSPIERRTIFEEAAKIMHFKEKKKEALRKLKGVEENLKRVLDIQSEVEQQIQKLSIQAEEAKRYTENKERLKTLEYDTLIAKWHHYQEQWIKELAKSEENEKQQIIATDELKRLEDQLETLKTEQEKLSLKTKASYEAFFEVKKSKEVAQFEYSAHQKSVEELLKQTQELKSKLGQLHQKHLKEQETFETHQKELHQERIEISSLSENLQSINSSLSKLEESVEKQTHTRKEAQQKLLTLVHQENEVESERKKYLGALHRNKEQLAKLLHQQKQNQENETSFKEKLDGTQSTQKSLEQKYIEVEKSHDDFQQQLISLESIYQDQKQEFDHLKNQTGELKMSIDFLSSLKESHEGYLPATQYLLNCASDSNHLLYKKLSPLSDWIHPEKGYEKKISTLFAPYLQTLIVESEKDFKTIFELAQTEKLGPFSCFNLEKAKSETTLTKPQGLQENPIACYFMSALKAPKESFLLDTSISVYQDPLGVYHHTHQEEQNIFLRNLELSEKQEQYHKVKKNFDALSQKLEKTESELKTVKNKFNDLKEEKGKLVLEKQRLEYALDEAQRKTTQIEEQKNHLEQEITQCQSAIQSLESELKKTSALHEERKKQRETQETQFNQIEGSFEENYSSLKENRSLKESLEYKIKKAEQQAQSLKEHIKIFESKESTFKDQLQELTEAIEQKQQIYQEIHPKSDALKNKADSFNEKLELSKKEYEALEQSLEEKEKLSKEIQLSIKKLREQLNELKNNEIALKSRLSELKTQIQVEENEIHEKLDLSKDELQKIEPPTDFVITKAEKEIRRLRRSLEEQPNVNLKALSECEEEKKRFEFLQSQIDDLNVSQNKCLEIITELDECSRQKFKETFEQIQKHFRENFKLLFNGGEADLKLSAHEDLLEAGIDIIAQPPGKKMRSIQLMSGGEKCLCAIALLFALFETQSIPFCILDEIDAPLDDINIERFTRVLKQFVEKNQFIIITHNKRTMAISDQLLGISMQEKGVTRVLPLKFSHKVAEEMAPLA